ncbi:16S rRNA (uracil(1498)-N(3))-methyltransferase [Persicitalea sp.]|uniref:RsmE family RNA methyltransferase n=1 Tax=Persicitalea sp. TaxID=3100273 RepID=UPI003592ED21
MNIFYQPDNTKNFLEGEEAQHCTKVLRMRVGDELTITDGRGKKSIGTLSEILRNRCTFEVHSLEQLPPLPYEIEMAICPTRKAERNEWMVEKMTEMGVQRINFMMSEHTHRPTTMRVVNMERLNRIALSAMKQSQQYYLPEINFFSSIEKFFEQNAAEVRCIAYVEESVSNRHLFQEIGNQDSVSIMIGPEGDFSTSEIQLALDQHYVPVSLGATRLRTETAAVLACHSVHLAKSRYDVAFQAN